jgi:hypothetical protein
VDLEHELGRLGGALPEDTLEENHHELHRRVVVIIEHHSEALRTFNALLFPDGQPLVPRAFG